MGRETRYGESGETDKASDTNQLDRPTTKTVLSEVFFNAFETRVAFGVVEQFRHVLHDAWIRV
jgi:hypothetical protein